MSTCLECYGNPCRCCGHDKPPGHCVQCLSEEKRALEERVDALESRVNALDAWLKELLHRSDA